MNVKRALLLLPVFLFLSPSMIRGQNYSKYWVFFKDKSSSGFNPYEYFDPKAIERRVLNNLPLNQYSDWPVNESYIAAVKSITDTVGKSIRWFNAVVCYATASQAEKIKQLPFVAAVSSAANTTITLASEISDNQIISSEELNSEEIYKELENYQKWLLYNQSASLEAKKFEEKNIDGSNIRIAIFDAGFPGVDTHPAFEHIRNTKRIVKTWDFVRNQENVYSYNNHGTSVMACIGGMIGEHKTGLATGAEFLLARTEIAKMEPFSEEENWLAAAEWADKNGAHIINSSLGYTYQRYFKEQVDGTTSLVSKAANMAASKGILIVNAAGNDGNKVWKTLGTPADADSVLTVGGIDPDKLYHIEFSSYGPTAIKTMKPNISAFGKVVTTGKKNLTVSYGTSFSSPLIAGFAACAWQLNPGLNNMQLFREIEKAGSLFPYYDYAHGYGIPQASYFTGEQTKEPLPTFDLIANKTGLKVIIKSEFLPEIRNKEVISDTLAHLKPMFNFESQENSYLYYHIENFQGYLDKYYVINVSQPEVLELSFTDFKVGQTLRIHYKGYTENYKF